MTKRGRHGGRPDGAPPRGPGMQALVDAAVREVAGDLERDLAPESAEALARRAVGHAVRIIPGLAAAVGDAPAASGPRQLGGAMIGGAPDEYGTTLLDLSRAILLERVGIAQVDVASADGPRPEDDRLTIALELAGPIAGTRGTEDATVMAVFDLDGAAAVIAELLAFSERAGVFAQLWALTEKRLRSPAPTTSGGPRG